MAGPRLLRAGLCASAAISVLLLAGAADASFVPLGKAERPDRHEPAPLASRAIDCSSAIPIGVGDAVAGSTVGIPNSVSQYGCSGWDESGGEVVYALSVPAPTMFEIRIQADCDLDVALLSSCDANAGCVLVADTGIRTAVPVSGTYYVVVDGYEGAACDFTLEVVAMGPAGVDQAACDAALPLSCEGGSALDGNTCSGEDQVWALGCEDYPSAGADDWYRVTLGPGGSLSADLVMPDGDVALWILGGCSDAAECLAYADLEGSGGREIVSWTNEGLEHRTVFLVVDSYGPRSCGGYTGQVSCEGVIVSSRETTWSALKARSMGEVK